jgi:hypothetical protein
VSLYFSLFRYHPRPCRKPLEDFLSEALVDLLKRLPREALVGFVSDALLKSSPGRQFWLSYTLDHPDADFQWSTQVSVRHKKTSGIVDILLRVDNEEVLVIENKVSAPIRDHLEDESSPADEHAEVQFSVADPNQLRTYGRWLRDCCDKRPWRGALVLLTHFSNEPDDFWEPGAYFVPVVSVCRWGHVWSWMRRAAAAGLSNLGEGGNPPTWLTLCEEFGDFLEEEGMTSDFMTSQDLATLQVFIGSADRISSTFEQVRQKLDPFKRRLGSRVSKFEYSADGGVIWAWIYLQTPTKGVKNNWHIGWGIRFPLPSSDWWSGCRPLLPDIPHVFVSVQANEDPGLPLTDLSSEQVPAGWSIDPEEGELIIARPLHELRHDPEGFTTDFADWVTSQVELIHPIIAAMAVSLK